MPFSASGGTYTLSDTIADATPASATELQDILNDIQTALNLTYLRDGTAVATGQFLQIVGATPAYSFSGDTDTGYGSDTGNELFQKCGGTKITKQSSAGHDVLSGDYLLAGAVVGPCPVGSVIDYAGTSAPSKWLLCYGQSLLRADYAALFTAIGTTYGAADGTHFNVPDCRGRVTAGKDDMGGSSANRLTDQSGGLDGDTLGDTGGSETHQLTEAQLPTVTPAGSVGITDPTHNHANGSYDRLLKQDGGGTIQSSDSSGGEPNLLSSATIAASATGITASFTGTPFGSGTAHNNVQPTIVLNRIIFAGV